MQLSSLDARTAVHASAFSCVTYKGALPPLAAQSLGASVVLRQS